MRTYAVLFPGQGSQHQDMLSTYIDNKIFRNTIIEASEALGYDIIETVKDQSKLNNTLYTQPILVATSTAMWRVWKDKCNIAPSFAAGHSLGEYSALVANGFIDFSDCLDCKNKTKIRIGFLQSKYILETSKYKTYQVLRFK